ncbi:MAG: VOC family protein, partial [Myxococcaceae bacterium]
MGSGDAGGRIRRVSASIDHLAVAATSLDGRGLDDLLGVGLAPGGQHARMGTHNRLLRLGGGAYLEIIAIDPAAQSPGRRRWFDLDDPALQHAVQHEPRLVHFVASTADAAAGLKALRRLGLERGPLVHAGRPTPDGTLRWQISVRRDGQR